MATVEMTGENVQQLIESSEILFIDFWAGWCGPCKMFAPVYEAASQNPANAGVIFAKCDTEANGDVASMFNITGIPTVGVFREKVLLALQPGAMSADNLDELVKKVQDINMDEVRANIAAQETEAEG